MLFSVGYQMRADSKFLDAIISEKVHIAEVYFSYGSFPGGRNDQTRQADFTPWEALARQTEDLERLKNAGIKLNLLFNANCYGDAAQSRAFFARIGETVDYIRQNFGLCAVTTTSPLVARFIRQNFTGLDIRASVNMGIGTPEGLAYVADYFDSFYVQREKNRDFSALRTIKAWCEANGKKMYLLANSGCLCHCSAHTFHDNLVAHEAEIAKRDNGYAFEGICREYMAKNRMAFLENTCFIRPEDISLYENIVPAVKLATRVAKYPVRILRAYIKEAYSGNLAQLLEPDFAAALYPYIVENTKITRKIEGEKLLYTNANHAYIRLEEDIC